MWNSSYRFWYTWHSGPGLAEWPLKKDDQVTLTKSGKSDKSENRDKYKYTEA